MRDLIIIITRETYVKKPSNFWRAMIQSLANGFKKGTSNIGPLENIPPKSSIDFIFWKSTMTTKEDIDQCLECRIHWRLGTPLNTLGAIIEILRDKSHMANTREAINRILVEFNNTFSGLEITVGKTLLPCQKYARIINNL